MAVKVLIVDDSGFFRRRVKDMITSDSRLEVVGEAVDGEDALQKVASLKPDIITMDIEMPRMDGITATRRIMASKKIPILIFSSFSTEGAKLTLDALDAGAVDYLPKKLEDLSQNRDKATRVLCDRLFSLGNRTPVRAAVAPSAQRVASQTPQARAGAPVSPRRARKLSKVDLVAIGSSTGGPVALQDVLTKLPANYPYPILLIQHMPGSFTPAFAERLNQLCKIEVREAKDGDEIKPGLALLAPGGMQMELTKRGTRAQVRIFENNLQTYKPSVDLTLRSVAKVYGSSTMAIILTGMGADGCEGSKLLKQTGSIIWSQDQATSTVYGMPAAVAEAGVSELVLPLGEIGGQLARI
ncbi:MAG: chemotaxis response regulator protein-glutamate methylesterase [Gammaproteobacteria bacterium]|nr:chemotaxis response regulator protein-glutamate methylesterase [Gammaproteobacteria bacterium]